jgi:hypothetical protein
MKKLAFLLVAGLLTTLVGPAASAAVLPDWRTTASTWTNPKAHAPRITNLRYATHERFDRVVIEVTGLIPGGRASYHRHFTYDGSGKRVPIRGGLQVALSPAYAHDDDGHNVYDGPRLARPGFPALKALAFTGDLEGVVSFAFGLSPRRTPYRIFRLHQPQRLVIDFKHTRS